ncbi:hypothetical protein SAMN05216601_101229 [Ectopseudomonas composti]|uniref:Transposase IS200 like n=1 Tax=Ectopseudomonas composti TaxID=658457 RepID=A0A1I5JC82_9GAMM|nr:hypothetical protein SAMN05216601_101229 [Pseudomonas composti]
MPNYRRAFVPGASWFFTVNLLQRRRNDLLLRHVELLRDAVRRVHRDYPFTIDAWMVLSEYMHCVWTLPPNCSIWRALLCNVFRCLAAVSVIAPGRGLLQWSVVHSANRIDKSTAFTSLVNVPSEM